MCSEIYLKCDVIEKKFNHYKYSGSLRVSACRDLTLHRQCCVSGGWCERRDIWLPRPPQKMFLEAAIWEEKEV